MAILSVFRVEWQRIWRNKLTRAAMLVGLILPLLYSFLYLWAFWNPYGSLNKLPVAVVNQDTGGRLNGKTVNYGHSLTNQLIKENNLDWHIVGSSTAMQGVKNGTYYAMLKIPDNFTRDILSVGGNHPQRAQIQFIPNQGMNYLAGNIIANVQSDLAASLNQQFSQKFIQQLLSAVNKETRGLNGASSAAAKLADGSDSVQTGVSHLTSGVNSASSGARQLALALTQLTPGSQALTSGLKQTAAGTKTAAKGVSEANNAIGQINQQLAPAAQSANSLAQGLDTANKAAKTLQTSDAQISSSLSQAASGASALAGGLSQANTAAAGINSGIGGALQALSGAPASDRNAEQALSILKSIFPGAQQLSGSVGELDTDSRTLTSALGQIEAGQGKINVGLSHLAGSLASAAAGSHSLAGGLNQASGGLSSVQSGLNEAANSLQTLASAQTKLTNGSAALSSGLGQAQTGATALRKGMESVQTGSTSLQSGIDSLTNGISTFAQKLNKAHVSAIPHQGQQANVMTRPISIRSHPMDAVSKYGPGLTPYFLPLSLWVGALMLYFIISLREGRWRLTPVPGWTVTLGKFGVLWSIGVLQAVVAASALRFGLGLNVTSTIGFYLFAIVLAVTYISVIGMLISVLGTGPGRFMAIVLLLLQLTSSGGTFPVQLVPTFFQVLHPLLPMSYAVAGLRSLIAFHTLSTAWSTVGITTLYMVGSLFVVLVFGIRKLSAAALKTPDQLVA